MREGEEQVQSDGLPRDKAPREPLSWLDIARLFISLAIVLGFVSTVLVIAVMQFRGESLLTDTGLSIADISTVYSGLTGAVIGYFFGRGRT